VIRAIAVNIRKIITVCLIAAVATSVYTLIVKKQWASWALLMVPGEQTSGFGLGSLVGMDLSGFGGGMLDDLLPTQGGGADITIVQQVLMSRPVLEQIILKYDLVSRLKAPNMERTLERFTKRVSVTLTPENLLLVSVKADSRTESAAMVQDLIDLSNRQLSMMVTSRARRARIETERSLSVAYDSLAGANARLEAFRAQTGFLVPEQAGVMVSVLSDMQQELILAGSELSSISSGLSARSSSWARASARYEYLHEAVSGQITGEGTGLMAFPPLDSLPSMIRRFEELYLEVETRRMVYLLLRQELENLRIEESRESPTIEVLIPPTPAHERVFPRRTTTVLMISVLAFVLAVGWIITIEWFRSVMRGGSGAFWRETWHTLVSRLRTGAPRKT
jgi:capsule polysaccharide export protein KpsE/RkpR